MGMYGRPVGDDVVPDTVLGAAQGERGSDQLGPTPEELGKLVWIGGFGDVADVGGDFFDDAIDDREAFGTDEPFVGKVNEETVDSEEIGPQD